MNTERDIRRFALEEAAVEMCGYCHGTDGHTPVPVESGGGFIHLFTHGNGSNPCLASVLHQMIKELKPVAPAEQDVHKRVIAALEFGRKSTKYITDKEAELSDGSERNIRLDAK